MLVERGQLQFEALLSTIQGGSDDLKSFFDGKIVELHRAVADHPLFRQLEEILKNPQVTQMHAS